MRQGESDLVIVGAGPAGVAAAVMAASLGMSSVVIDSGRIGGRAYEIGAIENLPGWRSGHQLACALEHDLGRLVDQAAITVMPGHVAEVHGRPGCVEVALDDGQHLTGPAAVVATGVHALKASDVGWLTAPPRLSFHPLWRAHPEHLGEHAVVLGADRPLGTWLRNHPRARMRLQVLCPPADEYKANEVARDGRVELVTAASATISPTENGGWRVVTGDGRELAAASDALLSNLGSRPAAVTGLMRGDDGYCPSDLQHSRVKVAGDLRSARFQRLVTAQGSGAQAVLELYYAQALSA